MKKANYKFNFSILIFFFILFLQFQFSFAQNTLKGKIADSKTSAPLEGATVYIPDIKIGAVTAEDGSYTLKNIPLR